MFILVLNLECQTAPNESFNNPILPLLFLLHATLLLLLFCSTPLLSRHPLAALHRLSAQIHRLPSTFVFTQSLLARFSATYAATFFAKVSDRLVKLFAIDVDERKHEIVGLSSHTLLKALTNNGLTDPASHRLEDIEACSSECEVNIAQEWMEKLPPRSYDEEYVLKRNSRSTRLCSPKTFKWVLRFPLALRRLLEKLGTWVAEIFKLSESRSGGGGHSHEHNHHDDHTYEHSQSHEHSLKDLSVNCVLGRNGQCLTQSSPKMC